MFTANEIREMGFQKSGISGYKAADVDDFCLNVADDFETLENSNRELVEKIKVLAAHIEKLKENEESVKTCMLNAQITADRVLRESDEKSKQILESAEERAAILLSEAEKKAEYIAEETKKKSEEFLRVAKEKADTIIVNAENEAIVLRNETDKKIDLQKQVYERLKKEILEFRDSSIERCEKQLEILKNISDAELILDSATDEDTTNEQFSEQFVSENFVPQKTEKVEEESQPVPVDEIEEEDDDETQGSFFEYQQ